MGGPQPPWRGSYAAPPAHPPVERRLGERACGPRSSAVSARRREALSVGADLLALARRPRRSPASTGVHEGIPPRGSGGSTCRRRTVAARREPHRQRPAPLAGHACNASCTGDRCWALLAIHDHGTKPPFINDHSHVRERLALHQRGTSGRSNTRSTPARVCPARVRATAPRGPTAASQRDCRRAGAGRARSLSRARSPLSQRTGVPAACELNKRMCARPGSGKAKSRAGHAPPAPEARASWTVAISTSKLFPPSVPLTVLPSARRIVPDAASEPLTRSVAGCSWPKRDPESSRSARRPERTRTRQHNG